MQEIRYHDSNEFRLVIEEDGKQYLEGYGIVFNSESRLLYGFFVERILPEAIDGADMSRIVSQFNHDRNMVLGTSWAGTLTYSMDTRGVKYRVQLPDTSAGRDVGVLAKRGDLRASSFGFTVKEDYWTLETREGKKIEVRTIKKFEVINDLSPVIDEAYTGTQGIEVSKRFYEDRKNALNGFENTPKESEEIKYLKLLCA
jgi:HK97 family phage prohead protease